jgi:GntR family transcriptional regulator, vanillate catabolism transcriptional regulator
VLEGVPDMATQDSGRGMPAQVDRKRPRRASLPVASEPQNSTRSAWLTEHLRQALLDGKYPLGSRLNEVHLSQQLKVSRTPISAALHVLAGQGLLRYHANKGFVVREFPLSEVVVAYEMRALAEGLAARLAAERGLSDEFRRTLEQALAEGDAVLSRRVNREAQRAAYAILNESFHSTIHAAARSDLLNDVVHACQRMPQAAAHNVMAFELTDVRERHKAHHQIYVAILGREGQQAETLMRAHVLSVKSSIVRSLARRDGGA